MRYAVNHLLWLYVLTPPLPCYSSTHPPCPLLKSHVLIPQTPFPATQGRRLISLYYIQFPPLCEAESGPSVKKLPGGQF